MRNRETTDSELRLIAALRRALAELGGPMPSTAALDGLLDERLSAPTTEADRAP